LGLGPCVYRASGRAGRGFKSRSNDRPPQGPAGARRLAQFGEISAPVGVGKEDRPPPLAAVGQRVRDAGDDDARESG